MSREKSQTFTVEEAATAIGIGRNLAYEGVKAGTIPSIRVGRRLVVPKAALARLLENPGGGNMRPPERG
jgi:excisionase family DNA binding protein